MGGIRERAGPQRFGSVDIRLEVAASQSKMLLGSQRKLDHPFQELIGGQPDEIVDDELLGIETHEVAQLQRLAARGIDEIAVAVVDNDDVALGIEP